jgi:hypothetical protein
VTYSGECPGPNQAGRQSFCCYVQAQAHLINEFFLYRVSCHGPSDSYHSIIPMVKSCLHGEPFRIRRPKPRHGGDRTMTINLTFSPLILFFASSSPRHHFFFPSSFLLLLPVFLRTNKRKNERTNENKRTITLPSASANLLAYHDQHFCFQLLDRPRRWRRQ